MTHTQTNTFPLVSVIIPTYNRPKMLFEALQSVLRQTYKNYEIIIVNDGGVNAEAIISNLNTNTNILYIKHNNNKGLSASRNTGIRNARGKYITYLDDDDIFYPNHIETLSNYLETNECHVAYTDAYRAIQKWQDGIYTVVNKDLPYSFDFDYDRILKENFIPVLCVMHRKSCFDRIDKFDENLTRLEDWDLWIRMSRFYRFNHISKITCEFRWRDDGSTMTTGSQFEFSWSIINMFHKYHEIIVNRYDRIISEALLSVESTLKLMSSNENMLSKLFHIDNTERIIATLNLLKDKYPKHILEIDKVIDLVISKTRDGSLKKLEDNEKTIISNEINLNENKEMEIAPCANIYETLSVTDKTMLNNEYIGNLHNRIESLLHRINELEKIINDINTSHGWKLLSIYYNLRDSILSKIKDAL